MSATLAPAAVTCPAPAISSRYSNGCARTAALGSSLARRRLVAEPTIPAATGAVIPLSNLACGDARATCRPER